jgi:WD40 repeat protein
VDEENRKKSLVIKHKLKCDNNSTLYCSNIYGGDAWKDLIFMAGTALGELIIWKNENDKAKTIYQKSLHNGVIFSIDYLDNYLVTSSDDRSIKVFEVNSTLNELTEKKQLFGHTSRVFITKIIKYDDSILMVSAGEDSNLCFWREDGTLQAKKNIVASGGIWNLDYDTENAVIVSASATGKLNKFQLRKIFYEHHTKEMISMNEKVQPSRIKFLSNGTMCVVDNKMQIYTKISPCEMNWCKVEQPEYSHKIVAIEVFNNRLFLVAKNTILIFDFNDTSKQLNFTLELNVDKMFPLSNQLHYFRAIHVLNHDEVFISDCTGNCIVVNVTNGGVVKSLFKIPKSIEPWSTSVAKIGEYWIVADRISSLFLYRSNESNLDAFHEPMQKLSRLHGSMGVTSITVLENNDDSNEHHRRGYFIKTTGNDGTIKTLFLDMQRERLEMFHCERIMVNWIEKMENFDGCKYILGFNDNYFVVYKNREIIYEHKCGGRHRHWHHTLIKSDSNESNNDAHKMRFAYICKKQVYCVEFYLSDYVFNTSSISFDEYFWHTKECNVVRVIDEARILISAGEDTFLKLTKIELIENDVSFEKITDINSHISSVKALAVWKELSIEGTGDDLLIFSAGGRAQIVLTRIIQMKYAKEEINFMLTDLQQNNFLKNSSFDPETRFTCIHFDIKTLHLFVGCSDGFLRVFKLVKQDTFSLSLQLVNETFYGRCILRVCMIEHNILLSFATDGKISFWKFNDNHNLKLVNKLQHNQNGINSFDVISLDSNHSKYKIATSGDDSGLFVTEFEIIDDETIKIYDTIKSYAVHVSQVTDIKFLSPDELLTTSIDQTVCKLKLLNNKIEVCERKYTCISDVKGFAILENKLIFVYGSGIEALNYF